MLNRVKFLPTGIIDLTAQVTVKIALRYPQHVGEDRIRAAFN